MNLNRRDFNKLSLGGILASLAPGLIVTKRAGAEKPEAVVKTPDIFDRCEEEFRELFNLGRIKFLPPRSAFEGKNTRRKPGTPLGPSAVCLMSPRTRHSLKEEDWDETAAQIGNQVTAMAACLRGMLGNHNKILLATEPMFERMDVRSRDQELSEDSFSAVLQGQPWMELISSAWVVWEERLPADVLQVVCKDWSKKTQQCRQQYTGDMFRQATRHFVRIHAKENCNVLWR